ncbi:hypothetical protein J3F84DRAFT_387284 [Trichoderma pleuroticola]
MAKRKAQYNDYGDPPPPSKRIKATPSRRFIQCGHFRLNLQHSPPPPPASPQRFSKRKLSRFSRTEPSDQPSTKRRKTTLRDSAGYNRDSSPTDSPVESDFETPEYDSDLMSSDAEHPSSDGDEATGVEAWPDQDSASRGNLPRAEVWPAIGAASREDSPELEAPPDQEDSSGEDPSVPWPDQEHLPPRQPNPVWAFYDRLFTNSHRAAMIREEERRNGREQVQPRRRTQLPSPAPSDGGTGGSHSTSINLPPATHTAPESPASPTVEHHRRLSLSPDGTNRAPRQSPKRRQPRRKSIHNQGQPQEKPSPVIIEDFLQSKRASRRNAECTLWQLDDKGTARLVAVANGR